MNILFKNIHIENFMSIGDMYVDLEDSGYTLIEGINRNPTDGASSNGSGKSTIFEALVWCLTGNTIRGNKTVVPFNRDGGAMVTLNFLIDGNKFEVTRTKDHPKFKTNLFIKINDEDKSGKGIRDTEKLFSEYLPDLTPSLIGSVIVLGQGMPNKFTNSSPSGRKEILEKLCKSDFMIRDIKDRIFARSAELNTTLRGLEDSRLKNTTTIGIVSQYLQTAKSNLDSLLAPRDYESEISLLKVKINEKMESKEALSSSLLACEVSLTSAETALGGVWSERDESFAKLERDAQDRLSPLEAQFRGVSSTRSILEHRLREMSSNTGVCPTCNRPLEGFKKPDTTELEAEFNHICSQYDNLATEINAIKADVSTARTAIEEKYTRISSAMSDDVQHLRADVSNFRALIARETDELATLNSSLAIAESKLKTHEEDIVNCRATIDNYEKELVRLSAENNALDLSIDEVEARLKTISKFSTAVSRDFRGYLLDDIIVYINSRAKEYCHDVFGTDLIDFCLDGNNLLISYGGKEYEALSGGERQKVDLIVQFSIRDMLCSSTAFSSNIIVLDEIFDNLDAVGCKRVVDTISTRLSDIHSIFIISHHGSELNIPCDNILRVEKDEYGVTRLCS